MNDIHEIHDHDGAESISEEQHALDQITHILLHALTEDGIGEKLEAAKSQQGVYKALQTLPYFKLTIDEFRRRAPLPVRLVDCDGQSLYDGLHGRGLD